MRRFRRIVLAVVASLCSATLANAAGTTPSGYSISADTEIYTGVAHEVLSADSPNQSVHVARIKPQAPVALRTVSAHDAVSHYGRELELPSDMCRRTACIAAVNADFHDPRNGQPLGGVASGGRLLRSPVAKQDQVSVTRDGRLHAGVLDWSGDITAGNRTVALTGVNVDRGGGVVLYTPFWGSRTPSGAAGELVVRALDPIGTIGAATAAEIVGFRNGSGDIPADGAVLSATGAAASVLRDLWTQSQAGGADKNVQIHIRTGLDVVESVGAHPVLLRNGQKVFPDVADGFTQLRTPRTLIGWNPAGEVVLVAVDGRRTDAKGMSLSEAADLLLGLGATDGANFDGGGGTTLVIGGTVANLPSDDDPAPAGSNEVAPGSFERPAANSFVIVPKPADPAPGPVGGQDPEAPSTEPGPGETVLSVDDPAQVVASVGDVSPSPDSAGSVGGGSLHGRLVTPSPDKTSGGKGKTKKGKGSGSEGADVDGSWIDGIYRITDGGSGVPGRGHALGFGSDEADGAPLLSVATTVAGLLAACMVLAVLAGLNGVRQQRRRARYALWL